MTYKSTPETQERWRQVHLQGDRNKPIPFFDFRVRQSTGLHGTITQRGCSDGRTRG